MSDDAKNLKKTKCNRKLEGKVVSDIMDKTIVVEVTRTFKHPLIGKTIRRSKKYKVHDSENTSRSGDWVEIEECAPLSKTKHMRLSRVITSGNEG
jgi:small subunit ribosomal protein S17